MIPVFGRVTAVLVASLWASLARAEIVPDLYLASVPVREQSPQELHRAAALGLAEVLVRVAGRSGIGANPTLSQALAAPEGYLAQYRYEVIGDVSAKSGVQAKLNFAQEPIDRLLHSAGLPVWGVDRPAVWVWLVVDDGKSRTLATETTPAPIIASLREQARLRGLPIRFAKLDATDTNALSATDVWQLDASKLVPAAQRYRADVQLLGRLQQQPGSRWQGAWALISNAQRTSFESSVDALNNCVATSINRVADALAGQYATNSAPIVAGVGNAGVLLHLAGVTSFDDYAHILAYLQQLNGMKATYPLRINGDEMVVQVQIEGGAEQLMRLLALDSRLQLNTPAAALSTEGQLQYRWVAPAG